MMPNNISKYQPLHHLDSSMKILILTGDRAPASQQIVDNYKIIFI